MTGNVIRWTLVAVSAALVVYALVQIFSVPPETAELEVVVENANLRLDAGEYVAHVLDPETGAPLADDASDVTALPPGEYHLRVLVPGVWPAQAETRRDVRLTGGRRTRVGFDFSYGELELEAEAPTEAAEVVKVQVFTEPRGEVPVIGFLAGERVKLAAGDYALRVVRTVESREKQVRWLEGITIEPGRRRQLAVAFERGLLLVQATNAGAPVAPADGSVDVFAAGDSSRRIVESGAPNLPMTLPTGSYDLRVTYTACHDRPVREVESVDVSDGATRQLAVAFDCGDLVVSAVDANGQSFAEYDAYTYLYHTSDHRSAIAYAPAGVPLRVSAGRYDVRASLFRSVERPDVWLRNVEVVANETRNYQASFQTGEIVVRLVDGGGRDLVGDEYTITLYPAEDRTRAVHRMQAGARARLAPGPLALHIENTYTGSSEWRTADVAPGELTEVVIDAP